MLKVGKQRDLRAAKQIRSHVVRYSFCVKDYIKHRAQKQYGEIEWVFLILFYYLQLKFFFISFVLSEFKKKKKIMRARVSSEENRRRLETRLEPYLLI